MKNRLLIAAWLVGLLWAGASAHGQGHDHAHHHGTLSLPAAGAPTLRLVATPDPMSGWNVHLVTENFRFAPEHVNGPHVAGEGHAHLYVDGKKVARLYSPWFHLANVAPGRHELRATLNANDHRELAVGERKIEAVLVIGKPEPGQ